LKIRDFQAYNFVSRRKNKIANYDIIGSIAILKFDGEKRKEKLRQAKKLLKRKDIKTVLEKQDKIKGRLRTLKVRFLAGDKILETKHKENNCKFRLNVEKCYFSPRLAEERKEIASLIKKKDKVLVMFSGVGPYAIVIAKKIGKKGKIVSIELGRECCKYQIQNIKINHVPVELIQGDVKKFVPKLKEKFSVIVMPRPNLRESFLKEAFSVSKKGTRIFYYCFGHEDKLGKLVEQVYKKSKESRKKIKIMKVKKAGNIAPYKHRYRIEIKVL